MFVFIEKKVKIDDFLFVLFFCAIGSRIQVVVIRQQLAPA